MGIRKLLTYCLVEENRCYETVDLVQIAQQRHGGIEILVDFYNFVHNFRRKFIHRIDIQARNDYLCLMGAEYTTLDKHLTNMLTKLKKANITLRFYIDGGRGTNPEEKRQKLETWKHRHCDEVDAVNKALNACCGIVDIRDFDWSRCVRPVLFEIQALATIKSCGLDVVQIPRGEANTVIASDFINRPQAYAIFTNDSDFVVFENSCVIPDTLFDINSNLQFISAGDTDAPASIICGVITNQKLLSSLNFTHYTDLIEMGIIVGNDYTGPSIGSDLYNKLNCRSIEEYADLIRRYKKVENIHAVAQELRCNHSLMTAIQHSRNFYSLRSVNQSDTQHQGYFTKLLIKGIEDGVYPTQLMAMHCNMYWQRLILEDTTSGHPCAEIALQPLRRCIYHMILPQQHQTVIEYGRTPYEKFKSCQVSAIDEQNIPRINKILPNKIFNNLRHFHYIVTHQELGSIETIWTDKYGRKGGFKFQLLRYFLLLNWGRNLCITREEFLALVAVVYGGYEMEEQYQSTRIRPSPRCATLASWLQSVYRLFMILASLLFISQEFSQPKEVYSGSVFTVFYYCFRQYELRSQRFNNGQIMAAARKEMNQILFEKRHIIKHLVEDCFDYDTRW